VSHVNRETTDRARRAAVNGIGFLDSMPYFTPTNLTTKKAAISAKTCFGINP
jgi:hypothetical protein